MNRSRLLASLLGMLLLSGAAMAQGPPNITITVDENGNGSISTSLTTGMLLPDPGPTGLASALTYSLLGPPSLVAGDLIILEPSALASVMSDIIRFNPAGTGANPNYPASLVFYSDTTEGADALADTGFPVGLYTNALTVTEIGAEGDNGFIYTPTAGQPGFVAGFNVTYDIISDSPTPEPATASLLLMAGAVFYGGRRWTARFRR
jgi:hypothetical protein